MRAALILALTACTTLELRIPRAQLQADLASHFPFEVDKHVVVIRVTDPQLELLPSERVGVRVHVSADTIAGTLAAGTVRAEGKLEYVEADHAFYTRDPVVTELAIDRVEQGWQHDRIATAARFAAEEAMRHYPIYRLDAARGDGEARAIKHLRSVRVDGQDLLLEVGL